CATNSFGRFLTLKTKHFHIDFFRNEKYFAWHFVGQTIVSQLFIEFLIDKIQNDIGEFFLNM
ncbi:MAG: hypothetical protein Q8K69_13540, partial [Bacteroidota bacterium]|nr:hypothetical protein [Bacteroidota bacterium]